MLEADLGPRNTCPFVVATEGTVCNCSAQQTVQELVVLDEHSGNYVKASKELHSMNDKQTIEWYLKHPYFVEKDRQETQLLKTAVRKCNRINIFQKARIAIQL